MSTIHKKTFLLIILLFLLTIFLIAVVLLSKDSIGIKSVSPSNNSERVSALSDVQIVFTKRLDANQQKTARVSLVPSTAYSSYWSPDGTFLQIVPVNDLKMGAKYEVKISYLGKQFSWKFSTASDTASQTSSDTALDQGKSDAYYAAQDKKFLDDHPWYSKLPTRTDAYFVAFDPSEDVFFADIYTDVKKAEETKTEVLSFLTSLGVDVNKYEIKWTEYKEAPILEL